MDDAPVKQSRGHATRTANKLRRRARILDCAREIIAADGYDALTLSQLARAAEVSVPTIHNLLGRKSDIIELIVGDVVDRVGAVLSRPALPGPIETVEAFTDTLTALYAENEALYRAAYLAGERTALFTQDAPDSIYRRSLDLALDVVRQAADGGDLCGEIAPEWLAAQMFGAQRLARLDWVQGYIDLHGYRRRTLSGVFIALLADATPAFRARLLTRLSALDAAREETRTRA